MFKLFFAEFRLYLCNEWINCIPSHSIRLFYYRKIMGFRIEKNSSIFMHTTFSSAKSFSIGKGSIINAGCRIDQRGGIEIGANVSIAPEVCILTADHEVNTANFNGRERKVVIENYVWLGMRSIIMPGVTIGHGAVVSAGAVVTKSVEPYSIVAGIPARVIGNRQKILTYDTTYRRLFQ